MGTESPDKGASVQRTPEGYEIPVPQRKDVLRDLKRVAKAPKKAQPALDPLAPPRPQKPDYSQPPERPAES